MLFWLLQHQAPLLDQLEVFSSGNSKVFITARTALAAMISFLVAWWCGPLAIRWLQGRFRERIDSASDRLNELHAGKAATPTMGGLFIVGAILVAALLVGDLSNRYLQLGMFTVLAYGALGAADDWIKISTKQRGLSARRKFSFQLAIAILVMGPLYLHQMQFRHGTELIWPYGRYTLELTASFVIWGLLVMVGSSNGVNLTDGLDGLAGGCLISAGTAFTALAYLCGHSVMAEYLKVPHIPGSGELCILFGAMVGSMLGFLWYNCHPAEVFMGDTGSLPLGALLGLGALVTRQEVLLVLIGGVFVVETLSVMLQVGYFKWTGRRILACSPLHNHYLFRGDHETKIVTRFWISSALLALVALASLKIR